MSKVIKQLRKEPAGDKTGSRVFSHLADLLEHYGRIAPARKAILAPGYSPITYGMLRRRANEMVRGLRCLGVRRRDRVAVVLPDGPETVVAIIAVAAGAVCVPLNPAFTADELHRYFADLRIAALLTRGDVDSASRGVAHALGIPVIDLSRGMDKGPGVLGLTGSATPRASDLDAARRDDDAFILVTSGTTSRPKMVPLTHVSVCLSAYNVGVALALGPRDRLLSVLPLFHGHGLISGLLASLAAGSSVVCTPTFEAAAFFSWLTEFRPSWYTAVPAIHRAVLSAAGSHNVRTQRSSLRLIRSASSSLPLAVLSGLEDLFGVPVIDTYGMTEAATQIAANPLGRRKPGSVGKPAGPDVAIMDVNGRRVPTGKRGEIVLRGPTITRGYDNDAAATETAFRDGWFRTGDIGYLDREGYLYIVGRIKDVINRGGQEVAPAEVEETLLRHPDVVDAVAFSIPHRRLGADVAAAVVLRPDAKVSEHKLRAFTRERLAGFKVPSLIRIVREIPRGPGGKIKRSEIADAVSMTPSLAQVERGRKAAPPRSELERQLAETWRNLLEVDQIDVDQDVFALGADSLTVTQMLSRVGSSFGIKLTFKEIFEAPTVTALADLLQSFEREAVDGSIGLDDTPTDRSSGCLSFQQQRIYVLSGLDPTGYNYHVVEVARLSGPLDLDALEASLGMICQRHEVLRSVFFERSGEPMQAVRAARPHLERLNLRPCAKSRRVASIQRQAQELLRHRFEIDKEPPLRAQLLQLDEDDHALVIKVHHLVTDGWSQRLFWEELEAFYAAALNGTSAKLPELPIQYRHFAEWQRAWLRTRAAEEQLGYWRAQLEGLTELPLRTDRSRPRMWTGRGTRHPLELSIRLSRRIKSLSRAHGATLFMTLLAAFQCLLHRYTQHEDIAVGSLIANRNQIQLERLIGMFANTIVLRTDLTGNPSFSEVLRRVRQVTLDAYRNQDLPIEEILKVLKVSRNTDRNTLFQVMFVLQNASPSVPKLPELSTQFVKVDPGTARFDLMLELIDSEERLAGWLEYSPDLFEPATMARMAAHFRTLLGAIVANPEERISRLPLLSEGESKRILIDWNQTRTGFGRFHTFFERFARQAKRTPHATAVSTTRVRLSYRELARRASAIADRLALGPDVVVVLLVERDVDFLVAMIAVHQAGGAFLPLDPAFPAARLAQIVQHSRAPLVLAGEDIAMTLKEALSGMPTQRRPRILSLEQLAQTMPRRRARLVPPGPSSLAYVIYTSGSTGLPKGAMVEQRGLFNHLCSQIADLQLSASDVVAQTAPQSFVIAVWQFLAPLMVGASVHICDDDVIRDPALLAQEIGREGVTVLQIVPALLRSILERAPNEHALRMLSGLRWLMCCGEPLESHLLRDWFRHFPNVPVINAYGSTEVSDDVATHRLWAPTKSLTTVPIGRPIANTRLYVLDAHLQPMPVGVAGELYVGGIGVGRGYLGDPEQTRRRFIRDPFSKSRAARLYRTGDAARWCGEGTLEFLGRLDHQVKVLGCRIELEEIEHVLSEHPDIQAATVLLRDDLGGEARLVAHIVAAAGRQPEVNELRDFLKTKFPGYMIPAGFIFLERMPLTAHGKVDRRALVAITRLLTVTASEFVAPRNTVEQTLADIWAPLLGIDKVSVFDNFFDLGGHSLLAGQVLARVTNALGVSLPIKALFEAPTVEALARQVDQARETEPGDTSLEIAPMERGGPPVVSIVQEHLLRIEQEVPGLPQFTLPFAYRLQGALDLPALERSLTEVVRRHDALRTRFAWVDERPVALVAQPSEIGPVLVIEDLAAGTKNNHAKALLLKKAGLRAEQEAWTPFDLTRAPLFRARLLRLDADDHILLLILHHIIVDGWSIGIFLDEVSELYSAFAGGQQAQLPEPEFQFPDFARWQRWWCTTDGATREFDYWKECLRQASVIFPANGDGAGAQLSWRVAHEPVDLPNDLVVQLSALSRRQDGTLFMTLLAGFKALLMARSGRNDICVATPMANRSQLRTEHVIGPLSNTTLIRTRINADMSFEEALRCVRDSVLNAYAKQGLPFDILAARLEEEEALDAASLTQAFFDLRNAARQPLKLLDVAVGLFGDLHREGQPRLPIDYTWLTVTLKEVPSGITGSWSYKQDLPEANHPKHWIADYKTILTKAAANPETPVGQLVEVKSGAGSRRSLRK